MWLLRWIKVAMTPESARIKPARQCRVYYTKVSIGSDTVCACDRCQPTREPPRLASRYSRKLLHQARMRLKTRGATDDAAKSHTFRTVDCRLSSHNERDAAAVRCGAEFFGCSGYSGCGSCRRRHYRAHHPRPQWRQLAVDGRRLLPKSIQPTQVHQRQQCREARDRLDSESR